MSEQAPDLDVFREKLDSIIATAKQHARLTFLRERIDAVQKELAEMQAEIRSMEAT